MNDKGVALIISNYTFNDPTVLPNFESNGEDCKMLKKVLKSLGYKVMLYENVSTSGIWSAVQKAKTVVSDKNDSLIIVLASHGDEIENKPVVFASDGGNISVKKVIKEFNNENCTQLIGKPKMFFVDACRGGLLKNCLFAI